MTPLMQSWRDLSQPRFCGGNQLTLLRTGAEFFPALELAIAAAHTEIHLETYIFANDAIGQRIAHALAAAAQRGVRTCVVVDGFGSLHFPAALRDTLLSAGVLLQVFRPEHASQRRRLPFRFNFSRKRLRRMHRKLVVVDHTLAFVGGINIMDDLTDLNHGALSAPRLDFTVRVTGPVVAPIHLAVHRLWLMLNWRRQYARREWRRTMGHWLGFSRQRRDAAAGPQHAAFVLRDNLQFRHAVEDAYLEALQEAQREVIIANAYFFPGQAFRAALLNAAQRGVKVTLLLQGKAEYRIQHYATQALYAELLRAGIGVVEYAPSFLHAKVAVVDESWATVGSSNLDPFSLLLAREANLLIRDAGFTAQLRQALYQAIEQGGQKVTLQHHAQRTWWQRVLQRCAYGLVRFGIALSGQTQRY